MATHESRTSRYVGELLRAIEEDGVLRAGESGWVLGDLTALPLPPFLRLVIERRLSRLDGERQRLLAVAAILGHDVALALWAAVALVDEETLLPVVEEGLAAHLLRETPDGTRVQFAHALVRAALYEGTAAARRRRLHQRAGETLLALPAPDADAIAYHFQKAGDVRAAEWLIQAGERAQAAYAWRTATGRYEAALALLATGEECLAERARLLFRLGLVYRYEDTQKSYAHLTEVVGLTRQNADKALIAQARLFLGLIQVFRGDYGTGLAEMEEGLTAWEKMSEAERASGVALAAADATVVRGSFIVQLAIAGYFARAQALAEAYIATLPEHASGVQVSPYINAYLALGFTHAYFGRPPEAARAFQHAAELHRSVVHFHLAGYGGFFMLRHLALPYYADDIALRERIARETEEAWVRSSSEVAQFPARVAWVPLFFLSGRWHELRELCAAAYGPITINSDYFLAQVAYCQGDLAPVRTFVAQAIPDGLEMQPGSGAYAHATMAAQSLSISLALDEGNLATARAWIETHDHWLAWSGAVLGRAEGQTAWAEYYRAAGDHDRALEHVRQALGHATEPRQPLALLAAHRLFGELATAGSDYEAAREHLNAALALAAACAVPYEQALTLLALAEHAAAASDHASARATLAEARAILTPLEARPALARADALAAQLTAPIVGTPTYPAGLSAREVAVLRLVATGLTNTAIGERLFLSPRTVQSHLRTIFDKLDVTTRSAATRFAVEQRLV